MTIEELVCKGEGLLRDFKNAIKEMNALGFNVAANPDDTLYVFKDTREEFGTKPPQHPELAKVRANAEACDPRTIRLVKPETTECCEAANGAVRGEN